MIVDQSIITGETSYDLSPEKSLVTFDVQNDSPYNVGVSLTGDVGFGNCEYHCPAEGLVTGMTPQGQQFAIGGETYGGSIWIYTQIPLGGTIPTNPPASQITVMGYPQGGSPSSTSTMSRLTNTGNSVNTNVSGSLLLQNDGNPAATLIIETTVNGQSVSTITAYNDGTLNWKALVAGVLVEALQISLSGNLVKLGATGTVTEIVGDLLADVLTTTADLITSGGKIGSTASGDIIDASPKSGNNMYIINPLESGGVGTIQFFLGGVNQCEVDTDGFQTHGKIKFSKYGGGSLSGVGYFSGTGSGTFSHGLTSTPKFITISTDVSGGGSQTTGVSSYGSTTCYITAGASLAWQGMSNIE